MVHQIKIIQAATLQELEKSINDWHMEADKEGLEVEYLGDVKQLPDGVLYYCIEYRDPVDPEEAEHHG